MNSNSRNVWYAIGALVLVVAVAWYVGFGMRSDTVGTDIPVTENATGTDGVGASNGGTGSQPGISGTNGNTGSSNAVLSDSALNMIIGNTLIRIPQTGIDKALTNGQATFKEGSVQGRVSVGPVVSRVKTDDGSTDAFAIITYSPEGKTEVQYIGLFHVTGDKVRYTSSVQLGSGVLLKSMIASIDKSVQAQNQALASSLLGYNLSVEYLARRGGDSATTTPTVPQSFIAKVKGHVISK